MYIKFIENLNAGKFERLGKFQIFIKGNGRIEVIDFLPQKYRLISEIPKERLEIDLEKSKTDFYRKIKQSKVFNDYIFEKGVDFSLNFDYGGGSVTVCSEIEGIVKTHL
jgi:RIO-like serine/threonine protein kinase